MNQSISPEVICGQEDGVFNIQLNRPDKKNALTRAMYAALAEGIELAEKDDSISVILLYGLDECFTSGNDIRDFVATGHSPEERPSVRFMKTISRAKKPVIAAVSGFAIGIGTTLLFHCDLIYSSEDCYFQLPFTRLGLCPEAGSSLLLPQLVGHHRAAELLLTGNHFSANEAHSYGLVTKVLPQSDYLCVAREKAQELAALPSDAVQTSKALIKGKILAEIDDRIDVELDEFKRLLATDDAQNIMKQFLEKKKA